MTVNRCDNCGRVRQWCFCDPPKPSRPDPGVTDTDEGVTVSCDQVKAILNRIRQQLRKAAK